MPSLVVMRKGATWPSGLYQLVCFESPDGSDLLRNPSVSGRSMSTPHANVNQLKYRSLGHKSARRSFEGEWACLTAVVPRG